MWSDPLNCPGFDPRENAHIFEIHPVRTVEIAGELHSVELNAPTSLVQDWTPDLSRLDELRKVRYWKGSDVLVFSQIEVEEQQYVISKAQASTSLFKRVPVSGVNTSWRLLLAQLIAMITVLLISPPSWI